MSSYRGNPRAHNREAPSQRQQFIRRAGRPDLPVPTTVAELDGQLAEIVVHETGCRWTTGTRVLRRSTESVAQAETRVCTCKAIGYRQHLRHLITRTGPAAPKERTP